jgi:hypothetical protein
MDFKLKLSSILSRLRAKRNNYVQLQYNSEYIKGFEQAAKIFHVAVDIEFRDYIEEQLNKDQIIRDLNKQLDSLKMKCLGQQQNIHQMQVLLNKTATITLSNNKKKKIFRALAEITGQPYEYVKEQFADLLNGKLVKRKGEKA